MSLDILKSIRLAEEEAEQNRKRSLSEANEILTEAKKESYLMIEKQIEDAEKEANEMIAKAEESAALVTQQIRNDVKEECSKMRANTMKRFDEAVAIIARKVVKVHGNS